MPPILELVNATLIRGRTRVLDGLTFTIHQGEHTAILGPNGAGKTSLIRLLTLDDRPRAPTTARRRCVCSAASTGTSPSCGRDSASSPATSMRRSV